MHVFIFLKSSGRGAASTLWPNTVFTGFEGKGASSRSTLLQSSLVPHRCVSARNNLFSCALSSFFFSQKPLFVLSLAMANLRTDSPLSRRIVRAFLDFLDSGNPPSLSVYSSYICWYDIVDHCILIASFLAMMLVGHWFNSPDILYSLIFSGH